LPSAWLVSGIRAVVSGAGVAEFFGGGGGGRAKGATENFGILLVVLRLLLLNFAQYFVLHRLVGGFCVLAPHFGVYLRSPNFGMSQQFGNDFNVESFKAFRTVSMP
jgi:hypothetical protein